MSDGVSYSPEQDIPKQEKQFLSASLAEVVNKAIGGKLEDSYDLGNLVNLVRSEHEGKNRYSIGKAIRLPEDMEMLKVQYGVPKFSAIARAIGGVYRGGIHTVGDLRKSTPQDLLKLRNTALPTAEFLTAAFKLPPQPEAPIPAMRSTEV